MNKKDQNRLRKILYALLAKRPDVFGIILEPEGWLTYKKIHKALMVEQGFAHLTPKSIKQFFHLYQPEGFEWNETRARAIPTEESVELTFHSEIIPQKDLYFAIKPKAHKQVKEKGLNSSNQDWIVLSENKEMAQRIGKMVSHAPVIGKVRVKKALSQGAKFFRSGELLVLMKYIKAEWLDLPSLPKERKAPDETATITKKESSIAKKGEQEDKKIKKEKEKPEEPVMAGSFFATPEDFLGLVEKDMSRRKRRSTKGYKTGKGKKKYKGRRR